MHCMPAYVVHECLVRAECNLHLRSDTLADGLQLCSGRRSFHTVQLAVTQVISCPHQETAQVVLADGSNGVQVR